MITLLDQLEASANTSTSLSFGSVASERVAFSRIWSDSQISAGWMSARHGDGEPIAMVLNASQACLTALFGAWRAGLTVLSLPDPSRMAADPYAALLDQLAATHGRLDLLADPANMASLPETSSVETHRFEATTAGGPGKRRESVGSFIQYTSGSTRKPAGVVLDLTAMAAGIAGIVDRIGSYLPNGTGGARVCSWLPLSHDMGLVGGCLTAIVGGGDTPEGIGTLLIEPAAFVRRPTVWLRSCAEFGASITLSSAHGLDLATRTASKLQGIDLSSIEAILVGGEMIRPETLDSFASAYAHQGLRRSVLRPAYGLAENTLAVTIGQPSDEPNHRPQPPTSEDRCGEQRPIVSCGPAVAGTEVRIASPDAEGIGEIAIRGASLFTGYTGERTARYDDGWYLTGDLGFMVGDELHPIGRRDDMLVVRGMNLMPSDIEAVIADELGPVCRNVAAVQSGPGYAVIIETRTPAPVMDSAATLRSLCVRQVGIGPDRIIVVGKRGLPITTSGKVQRSAARTQLLAGELAIVDERSLAIEHA